MMYNNMMQQPQPAMANNFVEYNGFLVDINWRNPQTDNLVNVDSVLTNSMELRGITNRIPTDEALTMTTRFLINAIGEDTSLAGVPIRVETHPQFGWGFDITMHLDMNVLCKRIYISSINETRYSPLTKTLQSMVSSMPNYNSNTGFTSDDKYKANKFAMAFTKLSTLNGDINTICRIYADSIYAYINAVNNEITKGENIKVLNVNGVMRPVMSSSLYEILVMKRLSVGGIIVKPNLKLQNGNTLINYALDLIEEITALQKGDNHFRQNVSIVVGK